MILTSSGSSNGNQWISGFNDNDFIFFATNGFKKLNKGLMSYVQPTYVAIKNNNAKDMVEVSDTHIPSTASLYVEGLKPTIFQSPMSILNAIALSNSTNAKTTAKVIPKASLLGATVSPPQSTKAKISLLGATTSSSPKTSIGFSIGGIAATLLAGFALYKIMEKK